jgi:glycosyltransferase involved in cell wall biosynthesis
MEGLGMVILEAMYFNVPVVASNIGGVPEIIEDQVNGILVQPRDYKSLAQAIMKVLVDGDLADQIRKNGQKTVKEFSLENMAGQVEATYAALLSP